MSNLEPQPSEQLCGASPGNTGHVEILEAREVPLGGLRGMPVRRTLPQRSRSLIGAWCFLDHYGPDDVARTGGMNVRAHPHTGLQTVSWLFSGTIEHRDSAGNHALVQPGELNLMTAGAGISHSERSTPDTTTLHGAQLWVALPSSARATTRRFDHYAPPVIADDGFIAQVFLGSLLGRTSPVETHTPLLGAELTLEPGTELTLTIDPAFEHGVLVDRGGVAVTAGTGETASVAAHDLGYLAPGSRTLHLSAGPEGARILLIGGPPFGEEIVMWWNFIGGSHEEVAAARADWHSTIAASERDDVSVTDRFGMPEHEPEPPLPAPTLPSARLKPRGQLPPLPHATETTPTAGTPHDSVNPPLAPATEEASMSTPPDAPRVVHEPDARRYAIYLGETLAGFAEYRKTPRDDARAFVHTEVAPEFGGRGLAGTLVTEALADTRNSGLRIMPYCPYVSAWLKKHPEYEEFVDWPTI